MILPTDFHYGKIADAPDEVSVIVRQGKIVTGLLKKATLGTSAGNRDVMYRQYGLRSHRIG